MPRNEDIMDKHLTQPEPNRGKLFVRRFFLFFMVVIATLLVSCRSDSSDDYHSIPTYEIQILSDVDADGDIAFSPPNSYIISSAATTGTVLAGVDPASGDEFRGFLTFPLRDTQGVPFYAEIESATLEIYISGVDASAPGAGVPLLFDLVSFSPPVLIALDFDRVPLVTLYASDVDATDVGFILSYDITPLMTEAQRRDLSNLQIRILLDNTLASEGLIEIENDRVATAPLLTVTYY